MYYTETHREQPTRISYYRERHVSYQQEERPPPVRTKGRRLSEAPLTVFALTPTAWFRILKFLPLNQVLIMPLVCHDFRDKLFNIPEFWKDVYTAVLAQCSSKLSFPEMDLWYQGLLCRRWLAGVMDQICDVCYAGYGMDVSYYGWLSPQTIRIPVSNKKRSRLQRERYSANLCGICRIIHYQANPESISVSSYDDLVVVTSPKNKSKLLKKYAIAESDITWLSPSQFTDVYIHIFARVIFGGEVGINAERRKDRRGVRPAIVVKAETRMTALVDQLRHEPML